MLKAMQMYVHVNACNYPIIVPRLSLLARNNVHMLGSKVMRTFLARKEREPGYEAIITPYM